jgi:cholesterol oxidase
VRARRVVVAGGALASTKLLLRSRRLLPRLGPALGTRFSGNGDLLMFARACAGDLEPSRGPTITTAVRDGDAWVEEAALPNFLGWLEQARDLPGVLWRYRTFVARYAPLKLGVNVRTDMGAAVSRMFGDTARASRTIPLLGMGLDQPTGVMRLRGEKLAIEWRTRESDAHFSRLRRTARAIAEGMGGGYADTLLWRLRRVATVHPLGGVPMGRTVAEGVVDPRGEAFGHPGLHVSCGAAMPGPVGPNPSLTIAAWAGHVAEGIAADMA